MKSRKKQVKYYSSKFWYINFKYFDDDLRKKNYKGNQSDEKTKMNLM